MHGEVSTQFEVSAPANDVWAVFRSPKLASLLIARLPTLFEKIDVIEGDGSAGTVLDIGLAAGAPGPRSWKEKFVTIDDEKRLKVVQMIEGGYLDLGFDLYEFIFKIIEKDANSCIIKSTIVLEADDDKFEASASLIGPTAPWLFSKAIANYAVTEKVNASCK